jgi:hypothetical protein
VKRAGEEDNPLGSGEGREWRSGGAWKSWGGTYCAAVGRAQRRRPPGLGLPSACGVSADGDDAFYLFFQKQKRAYGHIPTLWV